MKKSYFSTSVVVASCVPIINAAAVTTIDIICTNSDQRDDQGVYGGSSSWETCQSLSATSQLTVYNADTIECVCPSDSTKLITYTCSAEYRNNYSGDERDIIDFAYWNESDCYAKTCEAGEFLYENFYCGTCPYWTGNENATSVAGAVGVNECYVPAGTVGSDDTGVFEFVNDCYYEGDMLDAGGGNDSSGEESSSSSAT